jgi:hypothetical protein
VTTAVVIPFRSRGTDWRREANLQRALEHWAGAGIYAHVFDDGRTGDQQFNRSACYNKAFRELNADVFVFSEADLLPPIRQVDDGIEMAREIPGLVVPFSRFMAITDRDSQRVREHLISPVEASAQQVRGNRESIGAVNIVSRETVEAIGQYDENFSGAWFDDDAMEIAFRICCGPTRFVEGNGYHLFHLPGTGEHVTDADRAATAANQARHQLYLRAQTPADIRELTVGA